MGTELLQRQELALEYLMSFFTCEDFVVFLLLLSVMIVMTFGAAEPAGRSGGLEFLTTMVALFNIPKFTILQEHIDMGIILLDELQLPFVPFCPFMLVIASGTAELSGITLGCKLLSTLLTNFDKTHSNKTYSYGHI